VNVESEEGNAKKLAQELDQGRLSTASCSHDQDRDSRADSELDGDHLHHVVESEDVIRSEERVVRFFWGTKDLMKDLDKVCLAHSLPVVLKLHLVVREALNRVSAEKRSDGRVGDDLEPIRSCIVEGLLDDDKGMFNIFPFLHAGKAVHKL
jgi:hypothetical protein